MSKGAYPPRLDRSVRALVNWRKKMTELEAFEAMYGKSYLRTKKPKEYAIVWEAWQAATKAEREACARVAENFDFNERPEIEPPRSLPRYVAQAIRERSNGQS